MYKPDYDCAGGKGALIQELNTKDAYVSAPGSAAITVESLAGSCLLSAGGSYGASAVPVKNGIEAHLSGRIGHVMLLSHGGPIRLYLPHSTGVISTCKNWCMRAVSRHSLRFPQRSSCWSMGVQGGVQLQVTVPHSVLTAEQALTVLMRPVGTQALDDLLSSSSEEGLTARLGQWQRLSSLGDGSSPVWTGLDTQGVASLLGPLRAFRQTEGCRWLIQEDGSEQSCSESQDAPVRDHGLVMLDAAGGEVSVVQQSWTEMMAAKIGSPGVAVAPSKDL